MSAEVNVLNTILKALDELPISALVLSDGWRLLADP